MVSLTGLIWQYDIWMVWLAYVLLYVATVLTFWSMFQYMKAAWGDLTYHSRLELLAWQETVFPCRWGRETLMSGKSAGKG